jgi:hypothetical protein
MQTVLRAPARQAQKEQSMSDHVPSGQPAPTRDFEGILKELLEARPGDTLQLLCGVTLRDGDVITVEPAPWAQPQEG